MFVVPLCPNFTDDCRRDFRDSPWDAVNIAAQVSTFVSQAFDFGVDDQRCAARNLVQSNHETGMALMIYLIALAKMPLEAIP